MFRSHAVALALLVVTGCGPDRTGGDDASCDALCAELVTTCGYEAFPDTASCLQGCGFNAEEGADIDGQLTCVQEAVCDTFAIVECEHEYGLD